MKHINLILFALLVSGISFTSCGSDPLAAACSSQEFGQRFDQAGKEYETALNEFIADPENAEKCANFKTTGLRYVDELEDMLECARTINRDKEIEAAIESYRTGFQDLDC